MHHHRYDLLDAIRLTRRLLAAMERLHETPDAADGREALEAASALLEAVQCSVAEVLVAEYTQQDAGEIERRVRRHVRRALPRDEAREMIARRG